MLFDLNTDTANELAGNYANVSTAENPKAVAGLSKIVKYVEDKTGIKSEK